jgi:hypothetical protein
MTSPLHPLLVVTEDDNESALRTVDKEYQFPPTKV